MTLYEKKKNPTYLPRYLLNKACKIEKEGGKHAGQGFLEDKTRTHSRRMKSLPELRSGSGAHLTCGDRLVSDVHILIKGCVLTKERGVGWGRESSGPGKLGRCLCSCSRSSRSSCGGTCTGWVDDNNWNNNGYL